MEKNDIKKMRLGDFIAQILTEIVIGISTAQENAREYGAIINPKHVNWSNEKKGPYVELGNYGRTDEGPMVSEIEFDVLLTVGEDKNVQGGLGIFATAFGIGMKGESGKSLEFANRINFKILAKFPQQAKIK